MRACIYEIVCKCTSKEILHEIAINVRCFKYDLQAEASLNLIIIIESEKTPSGEYSQRYYAPVCNVIAIIMRGD